MRIGVNPTRPPDHTFRWYRLRDRASGQREVHAITDGVPAMVVTVEPDAATWRDDAAVNARIDDRQARLCALLDQRRIR
ncbi:hypothetical protein [Nocardioides sp.]|uniref:hypothetical protein n=1 Tax=Nocardioides sp. TaxID=35761 RepID=UPI002B74E8C2|nr:hypothetical protein [Nocardioides sp.]HXH79543.1 hypothetical protein [Nocardioides sp.]